MPLLRGNTDVTSAADERPREGWAVEGDPPDAIFFLCKDGSIRIATLESAFEPCDGCDCGWAFHLDEPTCPST